MDVFILAAGKQQRFPENHTPKQLLVINGETILGRQIRQLQEFNLVPTVVTKSHAIRDQSPNYLWPSENKSVIHTVRSTYPWKAKTLFLLGDVFYSKQLFQDIMSNNQPLRFWLTGSEIFAFSFVESQNDVVLKALNVCLVDRRLTDRKLWHFYRKLNGSHIRTHIIHKNDMSGEIVTDYSFDVDSLVQYEDVSRYIETLKEIRSDL